MKLNLKKVQINNMEILLELVDAQEKIAKVNDSNLMRRIEVMIDLVKLTEDSAYFPAEYEKDSIESRKELWEAMEYIKNNREKIEDRYYDSLDEIENSTSTGKEYRELYKKIAPINITLERFSRR